MIAVSNMGGRIFRINTGMAWQGKVQRFYDKTTVIINPGDIIIRGARPVHFGFEGASDYWGWTSLLITDKWLGKRVAVFTACEVKEEGSRTEKDREKKQDNFIDQVNSSGGFAFKAISEHDAIINIQQRLI